LNDYLYIRQAIHAKLVLLKKKYGISQAKVASITSSETNHTIYPKDINALNNLQNKTKWKGKGKHEKLELVLGTLRRIEKEQKKIFENPPLDIENELKSIVASAINAEFLAYQCLPNIHNAKNQLESFFAPNGSAIKRIHGILKRNQMRNWILTNDFNPSTVSLINCDVKELNSDKAIMVTKEYWLLVWFNSMSKEEDYYYEKECEQKYILVKNPNTGEFQIDINSYETIDKKVLPKVFHEGVFDDVLQKDSVEIAKTLKQVISIGGIEAALNILKQYSAQTNLEEIYRKVLCLESRMSEQTRLLNTEKISSKKYYQRKEELIQDLLKLTQKFEGN